MNDSWSWPDRSLEVPTLVISGDRQFIPAATAAHMAQAVPKARLVRSQDCGHLTFLECPGAVRERIDGLFRAR